jgi:hypothetical protein
MSKTYSLTDKSTWIYEPNYVRRRHRYRGPRESLKFNQEISQLFYDLHRIKAKLEQVSTDATDFSSLLTDGGEIDGVEYSWDDDATPGTELVVLVGTEILAARIQRVQDRIKALGA